MINEAQGKFQILALSGSLRASSTNKTLLREIAKRAPIGIEVELYNGLADFPIFSVDREGEHTPEIILEFIKLVERSDALLISSPEYVRAIPGGIKNAIDWLVSGDAIINKPIALAHASHRGEDMLVSLRLVLNTVSTAFLENVFLQIPLIGKTPDQIQELLKEKEYSDKIQEFLADIKKCVNEN